MTPPSDSPDVRCLECGTAVELSPGVDTLTVRIAGRDFSRMVPALVCPTCRAAYVASDVRDAFDAFVAHELWLAGVRTDDALPLYLDAFAIDPASLGATWREVKTWRLGGSVPGEVWPALEALLRSAAPGPARAVG